MGKIITQDEFITIWADKAGFNKSDVKILLDALIELFEEAVRENTVLKIKNFGRLIFQQINPRKVKGYTDKLGIYHEPKELPSTERVTFRLAEGIRYAKKD